MKTTQIFRPKIAKRMDESGVEPETFPMLRERATNYATRPCYEYNFPRDVLDQIHRLL